MNDERVVEEIVTEFLFGSCRLRPKICKPVVEAAAHCIHIVSQHAVDEAEADYIPLVTGSVAEFNIEPMIPHIGDYRRDVSPQH